MDVVIKRAPSNTPEVAIGQFLSSDALRSNPANHCVPILDSFADPRGSDYVFIVMPVLRRWHDPPFQTIGEFVDFVDQLLEVVTDFRLLRSELTHVLGPEFHAHS